MVYVPKNLGIKLKLLLKQNIIAFSIFFLWFITNFIVFFILTSSPVDALLTIFFFMQHGSMWGSFYLVFTDVIILGLILSLITIELFRKYNPKETCRLVANQMKNHVILIGYTHLAQRIHSYLEEHRKPYVIIDIDEEKVENLIDDEAPVIIDNSSDEKALREANIDDAKLVIIANDDIELLFLTIEQIREMNKNVRIIARCFEEEIASILDKQFDVETLSTSKFAAERIDKQVLTLRPKGISAQEERDYLIIGLNHISERLGRRFNNVGRNFKIIDIPNYAEEEEFSSSLNDKVVSGDPADFQFLSQIGIREFAVVILLVNDLKKTILILNEIRDLNKNCKIISRVFSEDMATIISKNPFDAIPISSSQETVDWLVEKRLI